MNRIEINPKAEIHVQRINDEHHCVVVDDFFRDPQAIVDFATTHGEDFELQEIGYPGMLYLLPAAAMAAVKRFIRAEMTRQFSFLRGGINTYTFLSMATRQPTELSNLQRLCHTDPRERSDRRNYAGLVYLFENERLGGTGFYRWKEQKLIEEATALEMQDPPRALEFLQAHFDLYKESPCYMCGSNEVAELLHEVPARFNRLVFYSGDVPHSANIAAPELLSTDFSQGRLTLNCFASVRPR